VTFRDARTLRDGDDLRADVCVIGSGAGGAVVAWQLARAGHEVLVVEEGGLHTKAEFHMREDEAFPMLYQEAGARATADNGISILQGRAVGGTTVVNYTTSFRTPPRVLDHWWRLHKIAGIGEAELAPHWEAIEQRLNIREWPLDDSNLNNRLLYDGCKALGLEVAPTRRNVRNCFKSGYCGMGCPVDAKQSMLVTYLPDAIQHGATVLSSCRVDRLELTGAAVARAHASVLDGYREAGARGTITAKRFVLAAGAIGTPAILLRSGLGEAGPVGKRTFLHPVVGVFARWKQRIEPFYGPPQSVASHALADRGERMGFFLEVAPLHPGLAAIGQSGFGRELEERMAQLPYYTGHVALAIDGFHPGEPGGTVRLHGSGAPVLDYPLAPRHWEAMREGLRTLARIDLAAGAERVETGHDPVIVIQSERDLARLDAAPMGIGRIGVFSAHVMGGAAMGPDPKTSVVRCEDLRHHTITNLYVVDGSVFPTSLGVNPQESIYGLAHLMGERIAKS
jgi:choline dehydrogenase-like flavoprotein